ncbi:hypothetical protein [Petrotoga sp. 9PWA.NaAc.5.4]|uniref:hypothetical protein n=1 Tax=Petrotoga sp. 9PWA.NaAc.5.4 TaxID=1434328 RepID=UPI000CB409F2|nr:hypothetical protein [Petrotoga sp. 9PWA.NaAc.5.4]PNR94485.1 hypothetical protein X924_06630 [Petrotoga sp. 9PWA.NaAc.5.4]
MKSRTGPATIVILIVFILPLVTFLLTIYTLFLKNQMNNLSLKIVALENESLLSSYEPLEGSSLNLEPILTLPELNIGKIEAKKQYNIKELTYEELLDNSLTLIKPVNQGAVKIYDNKQKAFEEALYALEKSIPYFIFQNGNKYYVYREDYSLEENQVQQYMFSIQIYLYTTPAPAMFPTIALRKAGIPAIVFNGKFQTSNEDYWSILVGIFETLNEAQQYMRNMDEEKIYELTGLSIKDRFTKGVYFNGTEKM